ncbi:hypothetical protein AAG747_26090 [Rapidithrix thailandica]|uniref:Uncharacterized protein n=1 Tax=Rapidithrix thailandica TaxID=413964 RepID=A0AAW9S2J5_9BACT
MLSILQFKELSKDEKLKQILDKGIVLCSRNFANKKVFLYALDKFYVEIWFNQNMDSIENILPFTTTRCLKAYLDKIDITDGFQ